MVDSGVSVCYFNLHGRAEYIRAMLHYADVPFKNEEITLEDWPNHKMSGRFPFNSMPLVTIDGIAMNQSKAAARAVAIKYGFYHSDPKIIHAIDAILDHNTEKTVDFAGGYWFNPNKDQEGDDKFVANFKALGELYENRLKQHGKPWIAGTNKPTLADFSIVGYYFSTVYNPGSAWGERGLMDRIKNECLANTPRFKKYLEETVMNDPGFKKYNEKKTKYPL